jgi:carbonic anhydrase/acetyltransferase-like protein (isoleucine patch superfamily)
MRKTDLLIPELNITGLLEKYPANVRLTKSQIDNIELLNVDSTALFGEGVHIGSNVFIEENVMVGNYSSIGDSTIIKHDSVIDSDVQIGSRVRIGIGCLVLDGASVCVGDVRSGSSDARLIEEYSSIGPGVRLHDEVEIGNMAIIPTQRTIANVGYFGFKNRVVTIYGSLEGPKFSIGCQIGVDFKRIRSQISGSIYTEPESANTYLPYLGVFNSVGRTVQNEFEKEIKLVEEIQSIRAEFQLDKSREESVDQD